MTPLEKARKERARLAAKRADAAEKSELRRERRLAKHASDEDKRVLAYVRKQLARGDREDADERLLRQVRKDRLNRLERSAA